jgi:acetylglutamate kinase
MPEFRPSAEAFAAAVERVAAHRTGQPVVVKLGGSAMEDPAATDACLRSVAVLNHLGVPLVLVHGGGKPIDRAMAEAGLVPKKVAGRRYTDDATLAIVVRVLHEINEGLAAALTRLDADPIPTTDTLVGERLVATDSAGQPVELGRVGKVTTVRDEHLRLLLHARKVPLLPPLGLDAGGEWLNLNADDAAAAVAGALKAERAIFLTDTPGVLRDRRDPASLIPKLTDRECRDLIAAGVIDGGMIPKVEACFAALEAGAGAALILDGRVPFSLLDVFLHDTFTGTAITR